MREGRGLSWGQNHGRIPGADSRGCGQISKQGQIPGEGTELRGKEISKGTQLKGWGQNSGWGENSEGGDRSEAREGIMTSNWGWREYNYKG